MRDDKFLPGPQILEKKERGSERGGEGGNSFQFSLSPIPPPPPHLFSPRTAIIVITSNRFRTKVALLSRFQKKTSFNSGKVLFDLQRGFPKKIFVGVEEGTTTPLFFLPLPQRHYLLFSLLLFLVPANELNSSLCRRKNEPFVVDCGVAAAVAAWVGAADSAADSACAAAESLSTPTSWSMRSGNKK